ncbi:hypothetical protein AOXY_G30040 [Acipenser oxyrinchus oxyrinchus]|uniref:Uncharacterized protein n=1 Tax=Acipenser oxyrinchus oxyrinchus TaxID=40147 RepID=A0AAD8FU94_ACIOX|nr:hypothetical protein AOXY_G30040 [Acipenser oxyrinchus oxyrinchus]
MSLPRSGTEPRFCSTMRATGHAEVWHDSDDSVKFQQYGWRCTKKEDAYSTRTLIGNWSEERRDLRSLAQRKPLPSQYSHYFGTTYSASYDKGGKAAERTEFNKEARSFPGHQPELQPPHLPNSCYRLNYTDPGGPNTAREQERAPGAPPA